MYVSNWNIHYVLMPEYVETLDPWNVEASWSKQQQQQRHTKKKCV